ncbi:unnamed protein product [Trichogramma brassicae]|uniref:BTB domain-containing protein n=1 Tax=Trichogramma brassicae TaxID=86971 RepID=A0A6H5I0X9_9HYME|nr:unnamed protein product [Trichogramma brassicae]
MSSCSSINNNSSAPIASALASASIDSQQPPKQQQAQQQPSAEASPGQTQQQQHFSLVWNTFPHNLSTGLYSLLTGEQLVDVTLAAEGQILRAHKLILSVCSTYFRDLFKVNTCKHPIVILKDVNYRDLSAMLQFMYQGEVNIKQEDIANFLKVAEILKIKGLTRTNDDDELPQEEVDSELTDALPLIHHDRGNDNLTPSQRQGTTAETSPGSFDMSHHQQHQQHQHHAGSWQNVNNNAAGCSCNNVKADIKVEDVSITSYKEQQHRHHHQRQSQLGDSTKSARRQQLDNDDMDEGNDDDDDENEAEVEEEEEEEQPLDCSSTPDHVQQAKITAANDYKSSDVLNMTLGSTEIRHLTPEVECIQRGAASLGGSTAPHHLPITYAEQDHMDSLLNAQMLSAAYCPGNPVGKKSKLKCLCIGRFSRHGHSGRDVIFESGRVQQRSAGCSSRDCEQRQCQQQRTAHGQRLAWKQLVARDDAPSHIRARADDTHGARQSHTYVLVSLVSAPLHSQGESQATRAIHPRPAREPHLQALR